MLISVGLYVFNLVCAARLTICKFALVSQRGSLVHCACIEDVGHVTK